MRKTSANARGPEFAAEMVDSPLRAVKRGTDAGDSGGVAELLDDFNSFLDTECKLITAVLTIAISTSYGIGCALVVRRARCPQWYLQQFPKRAARPTGPSSAGADLPFAAARFLVVEGDAGPLHCAITCHGGLLGGAAPLALGASRGSDGAPVLERLVLRAVAAREALVAMAQKVCEQDQAQRVACRVPCSTPNKWIS